MSKKPEKPIVIFTTFWDAEEILKQKHFLYGTGTAFRLKVKDNKPENYRAYSIALSHPKDFYFVRIDTFCPTYDMLMKYKEDKDWETYTKKYRDLMVERKKEIKEWFNRLNEDFVYILCCWENTYKGSKCHRRLLYDAVSTSKTLKDKAIYIYRHGDEGNKNL